MLTVTRRFHQVLIGIGCFVVLLCGCTVKQVPGASDSELQAALFQTDTVPTTPVPAVVGDDRSAQAGIDFAMEYYQASIEFWEQGDQDLALGSLDKAFALILDIDADADSDILRQKEDLRITIARRIVEVYASRVRVVNGYQEAIPLVLNDYVKRQIASFQGRERNFFINSYIRSGRYRPAILEALAAEGLPLELSWLPLIESGFKSRALSPARALGMWQFIPSTGYKFGLQRNAWIDERMDPEKSTRAAIAYLRELHGLFGDWSTALAAYNCGEGRVLRTIRTQRLQYLDDFWDLYRRLPRETAAYVPRFLAVLHIINDPEKYGFDLPPVDETETYERVTINRQLHLNTLAENIGTSFNELRLLNPELRTDVTPNELYELKVPVGTVEVLLAKLDDLPVYIPPVPAYVEHRVRQGESLSVLAQRYRSSVPAIMAANNLRNSNMIRAGMRLKIPTRAGRASVGARGSQEGLQEYVVQRGDSLWLIANRTNTTTSAIQSLNNLNTTRLYVGQALRIPSSAGGAAGQQTIGYQVRRGDSPYLIARRHSMSLAEFLRINNLGPNTTIFPGQTLRVIVR